MIQIKNNDGIFCTNCISHQVASAQFDGSALVQAEARSVGASKNVRYND